MGNNYPYVSQVPPSGNTPRDTRITLEESLFDRLEDAAFWEEPTVTEFASIALWNHIHLRQEQRGKPFGRALEKRGRKSASRKPKEEMPKGE